MGVKLSEESIRYLTLFESLTGASVKDCIVQDDKVIFVVKKGDMGLAIGKGGINVERAREIIGKKIEIIEHSDNPEEFIANIFKPIKVNVKIIEKGGKKIAIVSVNPQYKGLVIGKGGKNINKAKELAKRHHDIDDVIVK
ncbi:NusA-like transcription termination signal-binding factor [Archaeoglobus profundus]|uniref:Probable transcription termination protein NusA n=1 Tax=Archaeoglobus profundus (strain DSM 5631 / JCM 9629 / NBRC 100127 / Av18) TaxID=572546 RepID=D2RIB7_ARCPA|nr:NusA-like transcription termination signal-binding factor [Archaeoglobus profundus]ADB58042.1 NusA family KH domain protein [Archaeoglobus profundus DSM 5631]